MTDPVGMASVLLVALLSFPGISWLLHGPQHHFDAHPAATLIVIAAVLGLVAFAFRRRSA